MENLVQGVETINHYALMLDESGGFTEGAKSTKPSIVAGILVKGELPAEKWAYEYFRKVKASSPNYERIEINPFHAMEEKSLQKYSFMTELLCTLAMDDVEIVIFRNRKGGVIVDSDITYLNVFADGVAALIKELLQQDKGKIALDIFYAQRQAGCTLEINAKILDTVEQHYEELFRNAKELQDKLDALEKEKEETRIRIEEDAYKRRVMERVELLLTKLPVHDQRRIERRVTLTIGQAKKSHLLMLADVVCYVVRGGKASFTPEQKQRISELPRRLFAVPETEAWQTIENCFQQNHYAEGIFLWYGGFWKELSLYKEEFQRQLEQYFLDTDEMAREAVTAILSQYLQQLVKNAHYELAESYIAKMDADFFPLIHENPLMQKRKVRLDRLYFDLHFFRLTIATHRGDYRVEQETIETCRKLLQHLPPTYETLDYYLKYKLREIEHLKNSYDFRQAASDLEKLVKILTRMVDLTRTIEELEGFAVGLTSGTLGRVYGSLTTTRCFLGLAEPEQFAKARDDFEQSVRQFSAPVDLQRAYQNRAMVEYWSGQYAEALAFLSLAFGGEKAGDAQKVLAAILQEGDLVTRKFGLMHYTSTMARAMMARHPIGDAMMDAWQDAIPVYEDENASYPVYLIFWRLASCYASQGKKKHAKKYYDRAIMDSMAQITSFPSIAAGLVMQLERIALLPNGAVKEYIDRLKSDYKDFMASEIPDAMRDWFVPWQELLEGLDGKNVAERKPELLRVAEQTPIL